VEFGTYPLKGEDGVAAMVSALEAGYRLLDTAVNYGNEEEVGTAIRSSGVSREDVQVTTKIPVGITPNPWPPSPSRTPCAGSAWTTWTCA